MMKDVNVDDEIIVKWYEMAALGLPVIKEIIYIQSTTLGATVGLLKLSCEERQKLFSQLRMIINAAHTGEFIMNIYFEEEQETDLVSIFL